jgi:SAM-dependent methyltransferase
MNTKTNNLANPPPVSMADQTLLNKSPKLFATYCLHHNAMINSLSNYATFLSKKLSRSSLNKWVGEISRSWEDGKRILWVGAGEGLLDQLDRRAMQNIITIDIDVKRSPNVLMDLSQMGFSSEQFDIVCCLEVLEHTPEPQRAMVEIRRVLKSEGLLYLSTPFVCGIHDAPADFYRYTKHGLEYLLKDFEILYLKNRDGPLITLLIVASRLIFSRKLANKVVGATFCFVSIIVSPLLKVIDRLLDDKLTYGYSLVARKTD